MVLYGWSLLYDHCCRGILPSIGKVLIFSFELDHWMLLLLWNLHNAMEVKNHA
jgi:hypothetical protein